MKDGRKKAPSPVIRRLSNYHHVLLGLKQNQVRTFSSTTIAEKLEYKPIQVRKDLQLTGLAGRPKTGFLVDEMEEAIRSFIGWSLDFEAVLFGAGNLGNALLNYPWRDGYGLKFIAAFDIDPARSNILINNIPVYHTDHFHTFAQEHSVDIGVIAVPADSAQAVADTLVENGIRGVWNFSHAHLRTPKETTVEDAFFTQSLAVLTRRLVETGNARAEERE